MERKWLMGRLFIAAVIAYLSHWVIFEGDLFWQVRFGREIWAGSKVQSVDLWSHTAYNKPFFNHEWLSTVVMYPLSKLLPNYEGLGHLRSSLIFIWVFGLATLISRGVREPRNHSFLILALLIPWVYLACWFRLQMRPDLFATAHYITMVCLWLSQWPETRKRIASIAILLSWANFHAGTVPLGIAFFGTLTFFTPEPGGLKGWLKKAGWCAAAGATWFLTPLGVHSFLVVWESLSGYDHGTIGNPDFQPFSLKLLKYSEGGWALLLWVLYFALAIFSYIRLWNKPQALPEFYRNRPRTLALVFVFTAFTMQKIRVIHYQSAILLPIVAAFLSDWLNPKVITARAPKENPEAALKRKRLQWAALAAPALFLWCAAIPDQVRFISKPIGNGISDLVFPVQSVRFIREIKPAHNLLNTYDHGGYLTDFLPEYPVSIDGRGTQFEPFRREWVAARANTETYAAFLKKYGINVVLDEIPRTIQTQQYGMMDYNDLMLPRNEWAPVYMDQVSVVYLRRIPQHDAVIREREYYFLRRGLPAGYGASYPNLSPETRRGIELELDRCLKDLPRHVYCSVGKATFLRSRGSNLEAIRLLEAAAEVDDRNPELFLEMMNTYQIVGNVAGAKKAERRFKQLTANSMIAS